MTTEEVKAKWMPIIQASGGLTPEQRAQFGKEFADAMAEEIVSVQPMPSNIDWNALDEAYNRLRAYRRSLGIHCCMDGDCKHD